MKRKTILIALSLLFAACLFLTGCDKYLIFESNGGSEVDSIKIIGDEKPSELPDPVKPGFTFAGWFYDKELTKPFNVENYKPDDHSLTVYAKWDPESNTLVFNRNDGGDNTMQHMTVPLGTSADLSLNTYIKTGHSFAGWADSSDGEVVYEDGASYTMTAESPHTLYAVWTVNQYTYTFLDDDGTTVLKTETVNYQSAIVPPAAPTKAATEQYIYTFAWWDQFVPLTIYEDITFIAVYSQTAKQYTYTFYDEDGETVLKTKTVDYGSAIVPPNPTKTGTGQYTYTFADWDKDIPDTLTENISFIASYTQAVRQYTYTFLDDDGTTVLKTETVDYGSAIVAPDNPEKASTAQYTYAFAGWDKDIPNMVTADNIFTAVYNSTVNLYNVTFEENDGSEVADIELCYGTAANQPAEPERYGYMFAGWYIDDDLAIPYDFTALVTEDITLYAKWDFVSTGLEYKLIDDDTAYEVTGFVTTQGPILVIPSRYLGLPVTKIGTIAFAHNEEIIGVVIPDSVKSIGEGAFSGCENLEEVTFTENSLLASIGNSAFANCTKLKGIIIPESVISIGYMAFYACNNLEYVIFTGNSGLVSIGYSAFNGCSNLTSVIIPVGVTSLGYQAFSYCSALSSVTVLAAVPPTIDGIGEMGLFSYASVSLVLNVPAASVDDYKSALGWSGYESVIEALPAV